MAKKIFVRAKLVKSQARWHIDYSVYDPATGEERRHRKDFDLNEIEDLSVREAVAERIVRNIEVFAAEKTNTGTKASVGPSLKESITLAVSLKQRLPRKSSRRRYVTVSKPLLAWAKKLHYESMPVADFSRKHARAYWDHLTTNREYRGKTLNNYLDALRSIWNVLDERELVADNPWERIKPAREEEKRRRVFTPEERRIVANAALERDYWLFRGILLQFYCYVRPVELTRLRFRDFDFSAGTVTVREADAKQYRRVVKTIPKSVMPYFLDGKFERYPANYFMFGRVGEKGRETMEPSTVQVDEMRPYKRHARLLDSLKGEGLLKGDLNGLTWYSWKDSGISIHARKTGPVATKDQAGHKSLAMTSIYYHSHDTNPEYRELDNDLLL